MLSKSFLQLRELFQNPPQGSTRWAKDAVLRGWVQ